MIATSSVDQIVTISSSAMRWLFTWSWQALVLLAIAWLSIILDRSQSATVKYRIWLIAAAVVTILPLLSVVAQRLQPHGMPMPINWPAVRFDNFVAPVAIEPGVASHSIRWSSFLWLSLFVVWAGGLILSVVRLCASLWKLRGIRSRAEFVSVSDLGCSYPDIIPLDTGVVSIRLSNEIQTPGLTGFLKPVILLPADIKTWTTPDERVSILRHEFAHVKRRDHIASLLQALLRSLFFFHPVVRYACGQLSLQRELACDDQVLGLGTEPSAYAESILKAVERSFLSDVVHQTASFATRRKLEKRIDMIMDTNRARSPFKQWRFLLLPLLMMTIVALLVMPTTGNESKNLASVSGPPPSRASTEPVASVQSGSVPVVDKNVVWIGEVKRGPMLIQVRGLGYIISDSQGRRPRIILPGAAFNDVEVGLPATIDTHNGLVAGKVYIKSAMRDDGATFQVDVVLDGDLPAGVQDGASIDGVIEIGRLNDVMYVGRPVFGTANSTIGVFKVSEDGRGATRINVKFGVSSVNSLQVLDGLQVGDKIVLSDMSPYDGYNSIKFN